MSKINAMKKSLLITVITCILSSYCFAQQYVSSSSGGVGWKRVAVVQVEQGRSLGVYH